MAATQRRKVSNGRRKKSARVENISQLVQLAVVLQETFVHTNQHIEEMLALAKLTAGASNIQG